MGLQMFSLHQTSESNLLPDDASFRIVFSCRSIIIIFLNLIKSELLSSIIKDLYTIL